MSRRGGTRIYIGNISSRTRERDLEREFDRYGYVERVDLKSGFGFVEFRDPRDADDAVYYMNGRDFDGRRLAVEHARGPRQRTRDGPVGGRRGGGGNGHRIRVENLDMRTSWQDLKDFGRKAGDIAYTDVWVDKGQKFGILEYPNKEDFKTALSTLDDETLDGNRVRLIAEESSGGGGGRSRSRSPARRSRSRSRSAGRDRERSREKSRSRSPAKKRSASRSRSRTPSPRPVDPA